ncbi:MAG: hypothetical protein R3250_18405 [Melioribacteraceae bacterium]|nr:hypothetical protein [Melioribacteraceae bacterium]
MKNVIHLISTIMLLAVVGCAQEIGSGNKLADNLKIDYPENGFISALPAS